MCILCTMAALHIWVVDPRLLLEIGRQQTVTARYEQALSIPGGCLKRLVLQLFQSAVDDGL